MSQKPTYADLEHRLDDLEHRVKGLEKQLAEIKIQQVGNKIQTDVGVLNKKAGVETKKRILVIDDSKADQMIIEEILKQAGYDIALASDGKEGLERFYENPPDLVITDMVMPEKMGSELISEIKGKYPEQKIIAISSGSAAYGREIELDLAEMFGAYTIAKPFDPEKIIEVVNKLLHEEKEQEKIEQEEQGN
ncbi:MAG: response regulator [Thermodesulfobacteriota bacterium]